METGYVILGLIALLLITGMPIAFVLAISVSIVIITDPTLVDAIIPLAMSAGANKYILTAIILFMVAGEVMNRADISTRLINFAGSLVGAVRGGLAHVNILTSLFFSEISGTSTADAAAIGSVMIPQMKKRGYPVGFSAAVTAASSTMAIVIPPSLSLILYGFVAEVSIAQLFAAGFLPGVLVCVAQMMCAYIISRIKGYPAEESFTMARVGRTFRAAAFAFVIPLVILGGILGGVFTPTEAGAVAVLASVFLAFVVYRQMTGRGLYDVFLVASERTAMVMFIVAASSLLGWYLVRQRIPDEIASALLNVSDNYVVIMLLINAFFLLAGTLIHGTPAILMLVPIFLPLVQQVGVDPVHFGIIVTLNLGIGQLTPPVASVLLVTCSIAKIGLSEILPSLAWFLLTMVIVLLIVTFVPAISLLIPSLALGYQP